MRWSMAWPAPAAHPAEIRGLRASYSAMVYGLRVMVYGLACGVRGLRSMLWPMAWPAARCQAEDRGLWLWVWAQSMVYSDARVYEKQSVGRGGGGGARLADSETRRGAFLLQNGFRSANFVPSLFVVCVQNSRNRQHGGQRPLSYQTDAIVVSVSLEPSCDTVAARCAASLAAAEIRFVDVIVAP